MKIDSAEYALASRHFAFARDESHESLRAWTGTRPDAAPATAVTLSTAGRTALAAAPAAEPGTTANPLDDAAKAAERDPRLWLVISMIEMLTGRPVRVFSRQEADPADPGTAPPAAARPPAAPAARAGFGIEYELRSIHEEVERTRFVASGTVRTADGREIGFTLDLTMNRHFRTEAAFSLRAGDAARRDPLVLNFDGESAHLLDQRFSFDLEGDGTAEELPLLAGNSGYLAFDRNGNGRIDDGGELFGPASNAGFAELAALDADGSGWIDEGDPGFAALRVWSPAADRLETLAGRGIGALALGSVSSPFALRGAENADLGTVVRSGLYLTEDGRAGSLQEIDLSV